MGGGRRGRTGDEEKEVKTKSGVEKVEGRKEAKEVNFVL